MAAASACPAGINCFANGVEPSSEALQTAGWRVSPGQNGRHERGGGFGPGVTGKRMPSRPLWGLARPTFVFGGALLYTLSMPIYEFACRQCGHNFERLVL